MSLLAIVLSKLGDNKRAKRIYERHIAKHSAKFYDFYDLGIIYTRLKEYDKAEKMTC